MEKKKFAKVELPLQFFRKQMNKVSNIDVQFGNVHIILITIQTNKIKV